MQRLDYLWHLLERNYFRILGLGLALGPWSWPWLNGLDTSGLVNIRGFSIDFRNELKRQYSQTTL